MTITVQNAKTDFDQEAWANDWYKSQYLRLLEENKELEKECEALREQLGESA